MKRRILSIILSLMLVFSMAGMTVFAEGENGTYPSGPSGMSRVALPVARGTTPPEGEKFTGTGTEADPYLIKNADNLVYLANTVRSTGTRGEEGYRKADSYSGKYFKLMDNIDLNPGKDPNSSTDQPSCAKWIPIGIVNEPFSGIFDGSNKTISGLYIDYDENTATDESTRNITTHIGLFGNIVGATIKNLTVANGCIKSIGHQKYIPSKPSNLFPGSYRVGAIAGNVNPLTEGAWIPSTIENCTNNGVTITINCNNTPAIGGIAGMCDVSIIKNCTNNAAVQSDGHGAPNMGGVVGYSNQGGTPNSSSTMVNCVNLADVVCHNTGEGRPSDDTYDHSASKVGGVVGATADTSKTSNCANFGSVVNDGAYDGASSGTSVTMKNTGGVVGDNDGLVVNCVNNGVVTVGEKNKGYSGNVVGHNTVNGKAYFCYGKAESNAMLSMVGNLGRPSAESVTSYGIISGCGSFDADNKIALIHDCTDTALLNTTTTTYAENKGTLLAGALNGYVKDPAPSTVVGEGLNYWATDGVSDLLPTAKEEPGTTPDPDPTPEPEPEPGPDPDPTPEPKPEPKPDPDPTPKPGVSDSDDFYDEEYAFWMAVKAKIEAAHKGDVLNVNAEFYDHLPESVMEALRKSPGVTLVISRKGGQTIIIPAGQATKPELGRIFYPLSLLAERYKGTSL